MDLTIRKEVLDALSEGRPVVALESTVIAHGLPFPINLEVATTVESIIRETGAIPATICIIEGKIKIGLSEIELSLLAHSNNIRKCSPRDLPIAIARKENGATTVAGTMRIAHMAGINVFSTGGIGGVHRDHPFDTSADLLELGKTPMTVVCSGAKSILDLPLTLERLETEGVTVVGYKTPTFPSFYTPDSGLPVDVQIDQPSEVATLIQGRDTMRLKGSVLVTVPVPAEAAIPKGEADTAIERALREARTQHIKGKHVTPFLLERISELTGEKSLTANIALLKNNAKVAADIACALHPTS